MRREAVVTCPSCSRGEARIPSATTPGAWVHATPGTINIYEPCLDSRPPAPREGPYRLRRDDAGFACAIVGPDGVDIAHLHAGSSRNESEGGAERILAALNAPREEAKGEPVAMPKSRAEVASYLREVWTHDTTLPEPSDAMIDGVWALLRHPATTPMLLAVQAYERGQSYARLLVTGCPVNASHTTPVTTREDEVEKALLRAGEAAGAVYADFIARIEPRFHARPADLDFIRSAFAVALDIVERRFAAERAASARKDGG